MPEVMPIALTQLVLWYDATRIQTWPALLSHIPQDLTLPSATEFGRRFYTARMTDKRHAAAEKVTRNLAGLEAGGKKLLLRGVGLLEKVKGGYRISQEGQELAKSYRDSAGSQQWVLLLARLLLTREPRSRTLVGLLSSTDAVLEFSGEGWFKGSVKRVLIRLPGEPDVYPFWPMADRRNLAAAMEERAWWALGDWRDQSFLANADDCRFVGQIKESVSMHDVGLALRATCEVLSYLGLLQTKANECVLDQTRGASLFGPILAAEFGWVSEESKETSLIEVLGEILPTLRSATGHIVASELREKLRGRGVSDPDRALADLEHVGRILIYAEEYGQSRHGAGLYDDPRKQLIKLRLVAGGERT
ncbi:MAG: hypothetical protein KME65_13400 [Candidatus Thiodiazotropha sp. (ex Ctena orbiculata)]|uniref:Uncharacterized protein n=1 Tax=Candidatus Thiodiazotropha taylori TaxID=2792791 RepID=A0A944QVF4_9GAMM|nr:hypothetical protein [Candidatus Thiodiazotropha taylori]